jgi:ribosome-binding protein aMBF1 (putative translation factor)
VDLDMDAVREFADPDVRKEAQSKYRAEASRYGAAVRKVREARGLRQSQIPGLSDREVRRLEKGEVLPHSDTLKKLAEAHGWSVSDYMARLAVESKQRRIKSRK